MTVRIGSNVSSLVTQRYFNSASDRLRATFERLSSGARINRASDDPAGLSVSSALGAKSQVLGRARLNIGDAVSLVNIADSAIGQISGLLTRMAELAEQGANGVYSRLQRMSINTEFEALDKEIRRIGLSTNFNRVSLLEGDASARSGQLLVSDSSGAATKLSGDGNFAVVRQDDSLNQLLIRNRSTGETRTVSTPGIDATNWVVLDNGDIIYNRTGDRLMRYNYQSNSSAQIGNVSPAALAASGDGSTIAFLSDRQFSDGSSLSSSSAPAGGNFFIYVADLETGTVRRLNSSFQGLDAVRVVAYGLTLSSDGTKLAFAHTKDITGENADNSDEIFVVDTRASILTARQATSLNGGVSITNQNQISVNNQGKVIFSASLNLVGSNPNLLSQFFEVDSNNRELRQVSSFTTEITSPRMAVNRQGSSVFFASTADVTGVGGSSAVMQLFRLDTDFGGITRVTNLGSDYSEGFNAISADGSTAIMYNRGGAEDFYVLETSPGSRQMDFEAGFGAAGRVLVALQSVFSAVRGLGTYTLTSALSSRAALDGIRQNIESINSLRGVLGAGLSRLQEAAYGIDTQRLEITAAQGRIRDADIAQESATLVRLQILQQFSSSVLAQANQQPRLAVQLLAVR